MRASTFQASLPFEHIKAVVAEVGAGVSAHLWDVVVPPLPLLLLQLDGDASDRSALDALHQVRHVAETDGTS